MSQVQIRPVGMPPNRGMGILPMSIHTGFTAWKTVPRRRYRRQRSGWTLLELSIVVTISSIVFMLAVVTLAAMFRVKVQMAGDTEQDVSIARLASRLRTDAHEAVDAAVKDDCELKLADGRTIRYAASPTGVVREVANAGQVEHRDAFRLPRRAKVVFQRLSRIAASSLHWQLPPPICRTSRMVLPPGPSKSSRRSTRTSRRRQRRPLDEPLEAKTNDGHSPWQRSHRGARDAADHHAHRRRVLRSIVIVHRQSRVNQQQLQAEWLADAAVSRAVAHLAAEPNYRGETWRPKISAEGKSAAWPKSALNRSPPARTRRPAKSPSSPIFPITSGSAPVPAAKFRLHKNQRPQPARRQRRILNEETTSKKQNDISVFSVASRSIRCPATPRLHAGRAIGRHRHHRRARRAAVAGGAGAREAARRTQCQSRLSQFILAVHNYEMSHSVYPPGTINPKGPIRNLPSGYHHSWTIQILPYIEEQNTWKAIDKSVGVYHSKNAAAVTSMPRLFLCPSTLTRGNICYAGVHHDQEKPIDANDNGVFFLNSRLRYDDVTDGTAHTLFLGEKLPDGWDLHWMSGTRATLRNAGRRSMRCRGPPVCRLPTITRTGRCRPTTAPRRK